MIANGRVNTGLGFIAFFLTFYFSWFNNTWQTSLVRSGIGFIIFFLIGYLLRFILFMVTSMNNGEREAAPSQKEVEEKATESFQSIPLTSLHQKIESQRLTDTIRAWTKEDREG